MDTENFNIQITNKVIAYNKSFRQEAEININRDNIDDLLDKIKNSKSNSNKTREIYKEFGQKLFYILFDDRKIYSEFYMKFKLFAYGNRNGDMDNSFRIVLEIDDPYLQSLPWELIHDGNTFINIFENVSIIRKPSNFGGLSSKLIADSILKILIVLSNPRGTQLLPYARNEKDSVVKVINEKLGNTDQLQAQIDILSTDFDDMEKEIKYKNMNKVQVYELGKPTLERIRELLDKTSYNIIHYIGHSEFDVFENRGIITLSTIQGNPSNVIDEDFSGIFNNKRTSNLGLVLLDSCEGGFVSGFNGLAMKIIQRKTIPSVIAMQFKIADRAGGPFASKFYGKFIPSFKPEDGVMNGRQTLFYDQFGFTVEFLSPVLYMVTSEDKIFNINGHENGKDNSSKYNNKFNILKNSIIECNEGRQDVLDVWEKKGDLIGFFNYLRIDPPSNLDPSRKNRIKKIEDSLTEKINSLTTERDLGNPDNLTQIGLIKTQYISLLQMLTGLYEPENKGKSR